LSRFRPLSASDLERLDDEELIAYLRRAHAAGDPDATRLALQILVYGYWKHVSYRLARKLPRHVVEDATAGVIVSAIQSTFSGQSVGEFRSWLNTIANRATVDHYRAAQRRPQETSLEAQQEADDGAPLEGVTPDSTGYAELQMLIEQLLKAMRPDHRRVVEIIVFEDRPASAAVEEVPGMTADNAYQIGKRFRTSLGDALEGDT